MPSKITLKYGKTSLDMRPPSGRQLSILTPKPLPAVEDIEGTVEDALRDPVGSPPLEEIVAAGGKVTIVASDITRYSGTEHFMPVLLNELNRCGVRDEDVTILFALGIHRKHTLEEQEMLVGRKTADRIRLTDHDPKNDANLIYYGKTSRGTPVYINRIAARCDSLILTGTTTLHYFAGFGGGRKALIPGVAGYRTCMAGHFLVLDPDSGGKHPNARTAVLEGNPMHEDVIEGCRMVGPDFGLFTLLNDNREIGYVTGGDVYLSHLKACDELMQYNSVNIKEKSDMIIVGCGGFPKDLNLIQAHKSMEYAFNAVREGGVMIFVARCTDGFGNPGMRSWFRHKDLGEFEKALREEYEINGQTAYSILLKALKINIIMVSGLPDREVQDMSMTPSPDLDHALNLAESILGNDYTYHLIPDCSNLLPVVGGGED